MSDRDRLPAVVVHDSFAAGAAGLSRDRVSSAAVLHQCGEFAVQVARQDIGVEDGSDFVGRCEGDSWHEVEYEKVSTWQSRTVAGHSPTLAAQLDTAMMIGETNLLRSPMAGSTTVETMTDATQQLQHNAEATEATVREAAEAWLTAGGNEPLALQAHLTALFVQGEESQLGFEVWRLVCEAVETGWADERLADALSSALAQYA